MKKLLFILVLSLLINSCKEKQHENAHPNIVFTLADDAVWADVGNNDAKFYETPNIHKLAADGMLFIRFYPGAVNCAPLIFISPRTLLEAIKTGFFLAMTEHRTSARITSQLLFRTNGK